MVTKRNIIFFTIAFIIYLTVFAITEHDRFDLIINEFGSWIILIPVIITAIRAISTTYLFILFKNLDLKNIRDSEKFSFLKLCTFTWLFQIDYLAVYNNILKTLWDLRTSELEEFFLINTYPYTSNITFNNLLLKEFVILLLICIGIFVFLYQSKREK